MTAQPQLNLAQQRRLIEIDNALETDLDTTQLLGIKDELLAFASSNPQHVVHSGPRLSRIKLRLELLRDKREPERKNAFRDQFLLSAKRLLEPAVYALICRDAESQLEEMPDTGTVKIDHVTFAPIVAPLKTQPKPVSPLKTPARTQGTPTSPLKSSALTAPIHRLVVAANNTPIKFDPTRLFKEFGRERVLATWNMLPAEKRPETGAEFRQILLYGVPS